jgi:hypothetical protein
VTGQQDEWISAADAVQLLQPVFNSAHLAKMTICKRAHNNLIRSRAERFIVDKEEHSDFELPKGFWWAEGDGALHQNWPIGDFDTWVNMGNLHLQAFGVSFFRADIEKIIPTDKRATAEPTPPPPGPAVGGRPPADWWDDLWIEICRQLYAGDLKPTKQADIESAMLQWLSNRGQTPSTSTIRARARKLWTAIQSEGEN